MDVSEKNQSAITVPSDKNGERLDTFLAHSSHFEKEIGASIGRTSIVRGIKRGGIERRSKPILKPSTPVFPGESLLILPERFREESRIIMPHQNLSFPILYEDEHLIVINKPAGIETHPSVHEHSKTVVNWLLARFPEVAGIGDADRPGIVHRLDKETSGLLVIARTERAFTELKLLFKNRRVTKRYLAFVFGTPSESTGVITAPIARSVRGDRQAVAQEGRRTKGTIRPAETRYTVLTRFGETALIEAEPKTGRTHQIRVHLASGGHPVLGDRLYGSRESRRYSREHGVERHLLHATYLSFCLFRKERRFECAPPEDFARLLSLYKIDSSR